MSLEVWLNWVLINDLQKRILLKQFNGTIDELTPIIFKIIGSRNIDVH
jgi:hypothetical protein